MLTTPSTPITSRWRQALVATPVVGPALSRLANYAQRIAFRGSAGYWEARYRRGGTSGAGSFGRLARFKADVLNAFVREHNIVSVLELGCGDGEQLRLAEYPRYLGIDVSPTALRLCHEKFAADPTKIFLPANAFSPPPAGSHTAELALSLDVIYHLVEDAVYERYLQQLFAAARRYVAIYSSNKDEIPAAPHVRHRRFTDWIERNAPSWKLLQRIDNPFPYVPGEPETSHADMYFFERTHFPSSHAAT